MYRYKDDGDTPTEEEAKPKSLYGVEFTFDSDARVAITIYCQAFEEFSNGMAVYVYYYFPLWALFIVRS